MSGSVLGLGSVGGTGGGCCEVLCGPYTVTVTICGSALAGATVELKSGSDVIASGTTDSSGQVALTFPSAGTYTRVISASQATTSTASVTLACSASSATVALTAPTDFPCCNGWSRPLPATIFATTSAGTITMTYGLHSTGITTWRGYQGSINAPGQVGCGGTCVDGFTSVTFDRRCDGTGTAVLTQRWAIGTTCYQPSDTACLSPTPQSKNGNGAGFTNNPRTETYNFTATGNPPIQGDVVLQE